MDADADYHNSTEPQLSAPVSGSITPSPVPTVPNTQTSQENNGLPGVGIPLSAASPSPFDSGVELSTRSSVSRHATPLAHSGDAQSGPNGGLDASILMSEGEVPGGSMSPQPFPSPTVMRSPPLHQTEDTDPLQAQNMSVVEEVMSQLDEQASAVIENSSQAIPVAPPVPSDTSTEPIDKEKRPSAPSQTTAVNNLIAKVEDEASTAGLLAVAQSGYDIPDQVAMEVDSLVTTISAPPEAGLDIKTDPEVPYVDADMKPGTPPASYFADDSKAENGLPSARYECKRILLGHTLSVSSIKFSPDGTMLASSAADKTVKIWDANEGHIMYTFEGHTSGISDVAWSNDCEYIASASDDKTVRVWSLEMNVCAKVLHGHTNFVFCVNYNPSSSLLASGGYDESVRVWDVARGKTIKVLPAHSDPVTAVSFNHDGTLIASCAMDGLIRIWDADSGQCLKTLVDDDNPVCSHVEFSPNSKFLLASTQDSTIRLWNYGSSRCVKTYTGHTNRTYCLFACFGLAPSPNGDRKAVISGSEDHKVYIWDVQTRQILQTLEGHRDVVLAVATHPTKKIIASASKERDLSIRLWHA